MLRVQGDVMDAIEHLPFFLTYHGMDDRQLMESLARVLEKSAPASFAASPWLHQGEQLFSQHDRQALASGARKIRVGFVSKFFTMNHAHGQLLQGVMAALPRQHFHVVLFPLANPTMYLSPECVAACDETVPLDLHIGKAAKVIPLGVVCSPSP